MPVLKFGVVGCVVSLVVAVAVVLSPSSLRPPTTFIHSAAAARPPDCGSLTYSPLQTLLLDPVDINYILDLHQCTYTSGLRIGGTGATSAANPIVGVAIRIRNVSVTAAAGLATLSTLVLGAGSSIEIDGGSMTTASFGHLAQGGATLSLGRTAITSSILLGGVFTSGASALLHSLNIIAQAATTPGALLTVSAAFNDSSLFRLVESRLEHIGTGSAHIVVAWLPSVTTDMRALLRNVSLIAGHTALLGGGSEALGVNAMLTIRDCVMRTFTATAFVLSVYTRGGTADIDESNRFAVGFVFVNHLANSANSRLVVSDAALSKVQWSRAASTTGTNETIAVLRVNITAAGSPSFAWTLRAVEGLRLNVSALHLQVASSTFQITGLTFLKSEISVDRVIGATGVTIIGSLFQTSLVLSRVSIPAPTASLSFTNALTDSSFSIIDLNMPTEMLIFGGQGLRSTLMLQGSRVRQLQLTTPHSDGCVALVGNFIFAGISAPAVDLQSSFSLINVDLLIQNNEASTTASGGSGVVIKWDGSLTNTTARFEGNTLTGVHPLDGLGATSDNLGNTVAYYARNRFLGTSGSGNLRLPTTAVVDYDGSNYATGVSFYINRYIHNPLHFTTPSRVILNQSDFNVINVNSGEYRTMFVLVRSVVLTQAMSIYPPTTSTSGSSSSTMIVIVEDSDLYSGLVIRYFNSPLDTGRNLFLRATRVVNLKLQVILGLHHSQLVLEDIVSTTHLTINTPFVNSSLIITNWRKKTIVLDHSDFTNSTIQLRNVSGVESIAVLKPLMGALVAISIADSDCLSVFSVSPCIAIDAGNVTNFVLSLWNVSTTGLSLVNLRNTSRVSAVRVTSPTAFSLSGIGINATSASSALRAAACNRVAGTPANFTSSTTDFTNLPCTAETVLDRCESAGFVGVTPQMTAVTAAGVSPVTLLCWPVPEPPQPVLTYTPTVAYLCPVSHWLPWPVPDVLPPPTTLPPTTTTTTTTTSEPATTTATSTSATASATTTTTAATTQTTTTPQQTSTTADPTTTATTTTAAAPPTTAGSTTTATTSTTSPPPSTTAARPGPAVPRTSTAAVATQTVVGTVTPTASRSLIPSTTPTASRSLDLPPCAPPRLDACQALSGVTPTAPVLAGTASAGGLPTCTVPSFRDWASIQGSSFISNASTAGSNQTTGGADPPISSASARLVGSGLVSLLFHLEADGAVPPDLTPGSVASEGTFAPCGPASSGPASMHLCGSGGLAVTLVARLATNTTAESELWYAVAASDPPTAVRVEGILLAPLDPANATTAAASAHYTALGGAGSRGRVAIRLNLTLRVTVRMNVSLQDEPFVGSSGRLRFTPAPPVRIEAALTAFPITVRAPQPPLSAPSPRLLGDLYDVARSVCRASPSGLNLTRPVTAVALLAISDVPDVRLSRPALVTALAVTTTVVATVGAIVSPGIAVQQGIAQALLGLGYCGGGDDQDAEDDALPVLSHPLRFGLGRGDGTPAELWAASRRGALFSNLLLLPAAVALVAAVPGSVLAMLYLRRQQGPRSPQRALITMAVARDFVGFPSVALIPVIVTSEGTASASVGLLQRGAAEGAAGDAVLGVVGLLACAGLVAAWAVVLRRVLAAPARIHLQATAYAPYFQPRRWFPPWDDTREYSKGEGSANNEGSDTGCDKDSTRGPHVWAPARLLFPWAEWETVPAKMTGTPGSLLVLDESNTAEEDGDMALLSRLEAEASAARDLLRLDACIGEQWWRWAELAGLTASLVVGVCEGLDTDDNVPACRAAAVIALLASVAQGVSAFTSLAPLIGAGLAVGAVATVALAADAVARSVDSPAALSPAATEQAMGVVIAVGLGALVAGAVRAAAGFFFNAALTAIRGASFMTEQRLSRFGDRFLKKGHPGTADHAKKSAQRRRRTQQKGRSSSRPVKTSPREEEEAAGVSCVSISHRMSICSISSISSGGSDGHVTCNGDPSRNVSRKQNDQQRMKKRERRETQAATAAAVGGMHFISNAKQQALLSEDEETADVASTAAAPPPATRRGQLLATLLGARSAILVSASASAAATTAHGDTRIRGRCGVLVAPPPLPLRHRGEEGAAASRREGDDASDTSDMALMMDRRSITDSDATLKLSDVESLEMESIAEGSDDDERAMNRREYAANDEDEEEYEVDEEEVAADENEQNDHRPSIRRRDHRHREDTTAEYLQPLQEREGNYDSDNRLQNHHPRRHAHRFDDGPDGDDVRDQDYDGDRRQYEDLQSSFDRRMIVERETMRLTLEELDGFIAAKQAAAVAAAVAREEASSSSSPH